MVSFLFTGGFFFCLVEIPTLYIQNAEVGEYYYLLILKTPYSNWYIKIVTLKIGMDKDLMSLYYAYAFHFDCLQNYGLSVI
jgi:hypothetical protein